MDNLKNVVRSLTVLLKELAVRPLRSLRTLIRHPEVRTTGAVWIGSGCRFGISVSLCRGCILSDAHIGDFSYVGGSTEIKNAKIGKYCSIGPQVKIGLGIHPVGLISTYPGFYSMSASGAVKIGTDRLIEETHTVIIGNDVWIGTRAMIMDGASVGNGAIVAAGAIVTKDVPPYAIVVGAPARVVRSRFAPDEVAFLEAFAWWDRGLEFCREHGALFLKPSAFFQKFGFERDEVGRDAD